MFRYLRFVFILLLLEGCIEKPERDDFHRTMGRGKCAVKLFLPDTGSSLLSTIQTDTLPKYKYYVHNRLMYQYRNFEVTLYDYDGILVTDTNTQKSYFLRITGALNATFNNPPYLTINSSIGIATLMATGNDTLQPVSFIFKYPGHPPIISEYILIEVKEINNNEYGRPDSRVRGKYYFECPNTTEIVYGWDKGLTNQALCYDYHSW